MRSEQGVFKVTTITDRTKDSKRVKNRTTLNEEFTQGYAVDALNYSDAIFQAGRMAGNEG